MQLDIPREKTERLINVFGYFSNLFPDAVQELVSINKSTPEGITIEITPLKINRTRPQENYYRKYCAEFGRFCGMTPDEMHEELLCETYGSTEHATKFGVRRRPVKRSHSASKQDYAQLIETLCRVAAEMGYYVPPADEGRRRYA